MNKRSDNARALMQALNAKLGELRNPADGVWLDGGLVGDMESVKYRQRSEFFSDLAYRVIKPVLKEISPDFIANIDFPNRAELGMKSSGDMLPSSIIMARKGCRHVVIPITWSLRAVAIGATPRVADRREETVLLAAVDACEQIADIIFHRVVDNYGRLTRSRAAT